MCIAPKAHVASAYQVSPVIKVTMLAPCIWFQGNVTGMNRNTFSFVTNMLVPKQDLNLILNNPTKYIILIGVVAKEIIIIIIIIIMTRIFKEL